MRARFALAACVIAVSAACGGSSTPVAPAPQPTPEIPAAPVARLAVTVDNRSSQVAIQSLSNVSFDASTSSGTGLRYSLDYGDGQGVDQAKGQHVYDTPRTYKVRAIVTDSLGRVDSVSVDVVVKGVEGQYYHSFYNESSKRYESRYLTITSQSGRRLTGSYTHPEYNKDPFTGDLRGDRDVVLALDNGTITFTGTSPNGFNTDLSKMTMYVTGGSADKMTLTFSRVQ